METYWTHNIPLPAKPVSQAKPFRAWPKSTARRDQAAPRIPYPLLTKFVFGVSALLCILMITITIIVGHQMRQSILDEFLKRGLSTARNLAAINTPYVTTYNYVKLEQSVGYFVNDNDLLYAAVLFFDGEPAAFSGDAGFKSEVLHGEIHAKALASKQTLIQYPHYNGVTLCEIAVPIYLDGEKWGTVRVGFPLDDMQMAIRRTKVMLIGIGSIALLGGFIVAFLFSRRIGRPIQSLVKSVEAISNGDYNHAIKINTRDEIGYLGQSFSAMQQTVKDHIDLLTRTNSDLAETNQQLKHEVQERQKAEGALLRRDAVLQAVNFASEQLLKNPNWETVIEEILSRLGQATGVGYLYIFPSNPATIGKDLQKPMIEWRRTAPVACDQQEAATDLPAMGDDGDLVPIHVGERSWGALGFDALPACNGAAETIRGAIKTVADNLGAAIERRRTLETLRTANHAKDDFLANMSHELRTPLNHIIGFTELVVDKQFGELNDLQEEYLGDVLQSSHHLLSLINDILDLSKIEAGKAEFDPSEIDLVQLLDNSLVMVQEKASKHGIRLNTQIDDIPDSILADERKLKQILYNLLSNAVKFTSDEGQVTLAARRVACQVRTGQRKGDPSNLQFVDIIDPDQVTSQKNLRQGIEIAVKDTGIGIAPDDINRIFGRFDQVETDRNRQYEGTGLGLALVKSLVELHGGRIWAESKGQDQGSTFTFVLPC